MSTFTHILERRFPDVDLSQGAFSALDPMSQPVNRDFVIYAFLSALRRAPGPTGRPSKFQLLQESIIDNPFVGPAQTIVVTRAFGKAEAAYLALCHLARACKLKNARDAGVTTDLCTRPLA